MKIFERYKNLDGSSVKFRGKRMEMPLRHMLRLENILPAAYVTAATIPAYATSARQAFTVAAIGAGGLFCHLAFQGVIDAGVLSRFRPVNEKCLDRKPTNNTAPTTPDNLRKASFVSKDATFMSCLWAFNAALYNHDKMLSGTPDLSSLFLLTFVLGCLARRTSQMYMYGQVMKGKWVLSDAPPPRKVTETKKAGSFLGKFSPI